ncbi:MAG TPA: hypothetical protein VFD74_00045, partial [Thermoleophilia bacterium]|nr:hypothetical protein [Thermoleophilia bacterium]
VAACLDDPAPSVRVLAARSLPRTTPHEAAATLLAQVTSRDFHRRDGAEIDAFFEALAEVADDTTIRGLNYLWSDRPTLRSRPTAIRLGALKVAGKTASPAAREMLARATRSGDAEVRRQAKRILEEAERTAGGRR